MRDTVEADAFKHLSIRSLVLLAQRTGRLFASYDLLARLRERHAQARVQRVAVSQTRRCSACRPRPELVT